MPDSLDRNVGRSWDDLCASWETEIREGWFAGHQAHCHKEGLIDIIDWRRPGTRICAVRYMIMGNSLIVGGDLGDAVYAWSSDISLKFLAGCGIHYFAEKCRASEYGSGYREWFPELARQRLIEWENEDPGYKDSQRSVVDDALRAINSHGEWLQWLTTDGDEAFGSDLSEFGDIGMAVSLRCRAHLFGLNMAHAALNTGINQPAEMEIRS